MSRMTREERNARRRQLDEDPFHHALSRKTANAWRKRNRAHLNAIKRRRYATDPEFKAKEVARQKAYREAHPDLASKAWKKWADAHRLELREKCAAYYKTEAGKAKTARSKAKRRQRMATDPEYAERIRRQKREATKRMFDELKKNPQAWTLWRLNHWWLPHWRKIVMQGSERIAKYLQHAAPDARHAFVRWYSQERLINRNDGLGKIPTVMEGGAE